MTVPLPNDGETIVIRDNITAVYSKGDGWLLFKIDYARNTSSVSRIPYGSILGAERAVKSCVVEWQ